MTCVGNVSIRGRILKGVVTSTKMKRTIVIRRDYLHFVPKYQRCAFKKNWSLINTFSYEKRHKKISCHCSPAFPKVNEGDIATVGQCR